MTENQTIQRGKDAQAILDSEVFKDAMGALKSSVLEQWKSCPIRDAQGQVLLLQLAKLTDKFEGILTGMVQNGAFTAAKIDLDKLRDEPVMRQFMRKVSGY